MGANFEHSAGLEPLEGGTRSSTLLIEHNTVWGLVFGFKFTKLWFGWVVASFRTFGFLAIESFVALIVGETIKTREIIEIANFGAGPGA